MAEGIERTELVAVLAGFGCDVGQGFAIARPYRAADLDFPALDRQFRALGRSLQVSGPAAR